MLVRIILKFYSCYHLCLFTLPLVNYPLTVLPILLFNGKGYFQKLQLYMVDMRDGRGRLIKIAIINKYGCSDWLLYVAIWVDENTTECTHLTLSPREFDLCFESYKRISFKTIFSIFCSSQSSTLRCLYRMLLLRSYRLSPLLWESHQN